MSRFFHNVTDLIRRVLFLARPYGKAKLAGVFSLSLAQALFQVIGITSIFPFLAIAADPERIRRSHFGMRFLELFPPMQNRQLLLVAGVIAIVALLASNVVNLVAEYVRTRYAQNFGHWLRVRLLRRMASQPYPYFLQRNSADLLKKVVGDVMNYSSGVLLPLLDSVARGLTAVLLLATLFLVQPVIALSAAIVLGAYYVIIFRLLARKRREANENLRTSVGGSYREAHQMLSGIKAVKVHRAEEHFLSRFAKHSAVMAQMYAQLPVFANSARYLVEPLAFGGLVLAVLLLAAKGRDFSDILPNLGVMALAGYRLLPSLQLLYGQLTQISTMRHAVDEVYDEFAAAETDSSIPRVMRSDGVTPAAPFRWNDAIVLREVSFSYPSAPRPTLDDLSLTIAKNTSLGVIGPTGSGKSTLVDLLLGLYQPTAGEILIDGRPLTPALVPAWQASIGYVPQDIFLIDDTITRNIAFGLLDNEVDAARLREACDMAQILDFIEAEVPDAFDTNVGERGVRLSGGQRQRIGLARALYHRPSLLILDEATSALDIATEAKLLEALRALAGKLTMVVAAHRLSAVANCDQLVDLGEVTGAVKAGYGLR
ncbi:MAG: ABC transporter ATP-binding protein [Verrucomicrobia bacterium]|nr:MAG: ABC transporter ATP-binding protein [Verrucomicrobiota bacterium]